MGWRPRRQVTDATQQFRVRSLTKINCGDPGFRL